MIIKKIKAQAVSTSHPGLHDNKPSQPHYGHFVNALTIGDIQHSVWLQRPSVFWLIFYIVVWELSRVEGVLTIELGSFINELIACKLSDSLAYDTKTTKFFLNSVVNISFSQEKLSILNVYSTQKNHCGKKYFLIVLFVIEVSCSEKSFVSLLLFHVVFQITCRSLFRGFLNLWFNFQTDSLEQFLHLLIYND